MRNTYGDFSLIWMHFVSVTAWDIRVDTDCDYYDVGYPDFFNMLSGR